MATPDAYPINGKQKNQYHGILSNPPVGPDYARGGPANPNLKVFVVNFDGTGNDRDSLSEGEQATLVAASDLAMKDSEASHIESRYYSGVGTRTGTLKSLHEKIWGAGCERNAKTAHADLIKQVAAWKKENPDVEVHVHVVGFSRGAATGLHFMNLVDLHGAYKPNSSESKNDRFSAGNLKTSAVLFDNVSTGQGNSLMLGVPRTSVAVLHLTAGGEQRDLFPLHSVDSEADAELSFVKGARMLGVKHGLDGKIRYQRIQEIELPAARHSDVGGSYVGGGIREVSQYIANHFEHSLGLPVNPKHPGFLSVQNLEFHDSRYIRLYNEAEDLQRSKREVLQSETPVDHKNFFVSTRLEGIGMRARTYSAFKSEPVANLPGTFDHLVGRTFELRLGYDPEGKQTEFPGYPNLHIVNQEGPFHIHEAKILFSGGNLPGMKTLDEFQEELKKKCAIQHNRPGTMKIVVDLSRVGIEAVVNQSADAPEPNWYKPEPEIIPAEFMVATKVLNAQKKVTPQNASNLFNQAMYGSAKMIQRENPNVDSVHIYPVIELNKIGAGAVHTQKFEIECTMKDGSKISTRSVHSDPNIAPFQGDLRLQSAVLMDLTRQMRERGVKPTKACDQVFENGCDRPKRSNSMDGLDKPNDVSYHIGSQTSSILSTLLSGPIKAAAKKDKKIELSI